MKSPFLSIVVISLICLFCTPTDAQTLLRGGIYDAKTKSPIENAKFGIKDQGVGVITNAAGKFTYRKYHKILDEESTFQVSATGYFDLRGGIEVLRKLQNSRGAIYLEPISGDDIMKQPTTGKIAIFWDASAKSRFRNTEEEITYLKNYLQQTTATQAILTVFGEEVVTNKSINISAEGISTLENILKKIEYKGISDYGLLHTKEVDEILLFAEARPVFGMFQIDQHRPIHIINSGKNGEVIPYFESLASYTTGTHTLLQRQATQLNDSKKTRYVTGRLLSDAIPVPYAIVSKRGLLKEYFTDAEGNFKIPASDGDLLTFFSLGNFPKTLKVTDDTNYIVETAPKAEKLETITLKTKRKRSPYAFDSILQLDRVEGREVPVRSIYKSQFNRNAFTIGEAIDGIYGARSYYDNKTGSTYITIGNRCAKVFVDGVEMRVDAIPVHIVENISIFESMSMVLPCDSRVIVTTRMHPDRVDQYLQKKGYQQLKNNFYKEQIDSLKTYITSTPYFQKRRVTGVVKGNGTVLQGASVIVRGSLDEVATNANGMFSIDATDGDILDIKHFGMYPKSIVVTEEKEYTVEMITKAEVLDEVELVKRKEKIDTKYDTFIPEARVEVVNGRKYDVRSVLFKEDLVMAGQDVFDMLQSSDSRIKVVESQITGQKSLLYRFKGKFIPLGTYVDGEPTDPSSINPVTVERTSVYISPFTDIDSRVFITTRNHPDIRKKFLAENDIRLKNNTYKEEVAGLKKQENTYFDSQSISGVVTVKDVPLQGVSILKKGSLEEVVTDMAGTFEMQATAGDILEIKHAGMFPKTIVVDDARTYNIMLINKTEILEEVAVTAEKEEETKSITTAYGEKDRKSVGYAVEDELSKFVSSADVSFEQVALKIPGVVVDPGTKQLFFQRSFGAIGKSPIMIVIDGGTVSQNTLNTIDPQTITNITALKGVAATNRYGSQAFGGVLLVETLNGSFTENQEAPDLTLKNNIYKETLPTLNFDAVKEDYVDDVASKLSTKIKLEKYRSIKNVYLDKVDFYVDMALYFQQIDAGAAREVRNDFALLAKDNLKALRILAYLNEHAGEFMQAQKVYERVATMDPGNPQSYRDLALIYQETGEYNKALELYVNMLGDQIPGIDFSNLSSVLSNELQRLINLYKHKINFQRLPNDWLTTNFNIDVRMTASWSDVNAPFEFQFVNPKKRFYNWNSDAEATGENDAEKSTEEFVIDDATPGKWLINVRYTGDENATNIPPYLKYTVYKDFGTPKETRTIKLVKLESQIQKVTLDSFVY